MLKALKETCFCTIRTKTKSIAKIITASIIYMTDHKSLDLLYLIKFYGIDKAVMKSLKTSDRSKGHMNETEDAKKKWTDDDIAWIYPSGLPVPAFDREQMRTCLIPKYGKKLSDYELDLVIYDNVVFYAKNHKQLILSFILSDAGFQPVLSEVIDDIQQRWKKSLPICKKIVKERKTDWNTTMRELMLTI